MRCWLAVTACLATPVAAQTPAPVPAAVAAPQPIRASKIILVGDSTVQAGSGWGGAFCAHHVTSFATCVNMARGGRSSSSYRAEGSWALALAEMKTAGFVATYVLIGFGHNDQPGKPGRSTDLATEFPVNMARYIAEIRAAGAVPILFTPLTRRQFKDGKLIRDLDGWAAAIRTLGADTKTPVIDIYRQSADEVQAMGAAAAARFAQLPPPPEVLIAAEKGTTISAAQTEVPVQTVSPAAAAMRLGDPRRAFDYTHLGRDGADHYATMATLEIARVVPALRPVLIP